MKKYFLIVIFILIITVTLIFFYGDIVSGSVSNSLKDSIILEDSIIIRDIEMESEIPMSESNSEIEGQIIYDDAFDDTIIDYDRVKNKKNIDNIVVDEKIDIKRLKLKDRRWHFTRYKIRKRDNLWKIAKRFGVDHKLIISTNSIKNPDMLLPGRYINIPNRRGIYIKIRKGDTLSGISRRYHVKARKIIIHNNLDPNVIQAGKSIFIPDAVQKKTASIARTRKKRRYTHIAKKRLKFSWPLRGRITSGFGRRKDPFSGKRRFHCGIDISANIGTPIKAAARGRIIFSGWKPGYGKVVIVRHKGGYISVYAHNSKNIAKVNSMVNRGKTIAYSGKTGAVTGAHLHFEIRKYITPLNPMRLLQ